MKTKQTCIALVGLGLCFIIIITAYFYRDYNKKPFTTERSSVVLPQDAHVDWLTYKNKTYSYSIKYPSEWKAEAFPLEYNKPNDGVTLTHIPSGGIFGSYQGDYYLSLMVYPNINMSLEEWAAWFNNADKNFFDRTEFIEINGLKFIKGTYDTPNNNMSGNWTMKSNQYFTIKNNIGYFFKANYSNSTDKITVEMLRTFVPSASNQVPSMNNTSGEFISFNKKETSDKNIYRSKKYGFSLELPNSWTSYYVTATENEGSTEIDFSLPQGYNDVGSFGSPIKILALSKDKFKGLWDCKNATEPCNAPLPLKANKNYFFGGYALDNSNDGDNMEGYCEKQTQHRYFCDARNDTKKFLQKSFFLNAFKIID